MSEPRVTTEEAERVANALNRFTFEMPSYPERERARVEAMSALCSLAAERDALREAMETATDCCARATACGRILRDALGENQP